ncbi:hypothetical protein P378_03215 [Desulforamulus profundi]|uniref:Uncharacterized protein n=1 Tax=Desulforamulus profundi TaxID=1383067 RepID=A0A2C6L3W8_9FIRM|nr:hypothetical protein P378_03215 [Desulforamulus profundi]
MKIQQTGGIALVSDQRGRITRVLEHGLHCAGITGWGRPWNVRLLPALQPQNWSWRINKNNFVF